MNNLFTPIKVIGSGGSAYIIQALVNYDHGELKRGDMVIFKHCMGYLTKLACNLFTDEARVLNDLKINLADRGICNNFPLYYGYLTECLFGSLEMLDNISQLGDEISDVLFYYANIPEMGIQLYEKLRSIYSIDYILRIRDKLKIPNFQVIAELYPFTDDSYDSHNIYEFLMEELDVDCSPNIVMSKIVGSDLSSLPLFKLTDGLLFENIYTNACLIRYNGHIFRDINLGNIMIEMYPYPRIYKIKDIYYLFTDGYRLVIIDAQVTAPATNTRDLLGNIISRIDNNTGIVTAIQNSNDVDTVMYSVMPIFFKSHIVTEQYIKEIMMAYPTIKIWTYV